MDDRFHTRESAAAYLGTSTRSIDRYAASGKLAASFLGASKRFRQSDLDRLVASAPKSPAAMRFGRAQTVA